MAPSPFRLSCFSPLCFFFFFKDTATTEIYTLSLHDALPIPPAGCRLSYAGLDGKLRQTALRFDPDPTELDRKSTRLNSSHVSISYAVFCLKKKKNRTIQRTHCAVFRS